MWNSDQHQRDIVHKFQSSEATSQLDDFLNAWRDELCRTKGILRLNDDCLYKIFSYLPMIDLCTVNETCRDFQRISHDYFEAYSNRVGWDKLNFDGVRKNLIRLSDAKRFIRIFGSHLTKLDLRSDAFQVYEKPIRLLPLLDRYCTKLQTLTIDVSFSDPMISIIVYRRLFSDLHRLTIGSYMSHKDSLLVQIDVDMILSYLVSLKHLEINRMKWIVEEVVYDAKRYKPLESLSLRNSTLPRIDILTAFLSENDQLKRLKLSSCYFMKTDKNLTLTLPSLPNMESFWVRFRDHKYRPSVKDFNKKQMNRLHLSNISGDLSALKKLSIDLNIFQQSNLNSILGRLATHNVIEKVDIVGTDAYPDELESHLCAFTNLKVLRLSYVKGFNKEIIRTLACGLPNLTYIGFKCCDVDYSMMENLMEFSHNVITISLSPKTDSPLTSAMLSSMIDARLRNQYRKPTPLELILNEYIICNGIRLEERLKALLVDCANVIKILPSDYLQNLVCPYNSKPIVRVPYKLLCIPRTCLQTVQQVTENVE